MLPGELKPILTALVLPPAGPLLLALLGLALAWRRHARTGHALVLVAVAALWLASCNAVASFLSAQLVPQWAPIAREQLQSVQAVVVLGGGVRDPAPEYGAAQPSGNTFARLRYGVHLVRLSGKPLGFAGGVGWASAGQAREAHVAAEVLKDYGLQLRWSDDRSRDTAENAREMARLLQPDGMRRIALVTDSWHMARAVAEFRRAGFDVVPAPTGLPTPATGLLAWVPSAQALNTTSAVLRERLGLAVLALTGGR